MSKYEKQVYKELVAWQEEMQLGPSLVGKATKAVQVKINQMVPEKIHKIITETIKQMIKGVITGADITTTWPQSWRKKPQYSSIEELENKVKGKIKFYRNTATAEGAATGFGGFVWGLADFPLWLTIKMKMLFEIASNSGYDVRDYRERIYILHIFQLTFSSQQHRNKIYKIIENWEIEKEQLPENFNEFDWRTFQLEYRDRIDLAKLLQLIPGIGAIVGAYVNHRFTNQLGQNAMNAYRMRYLKSESHESGHFSNKSMPKSS